MDEDRTHRSPAAQHLLTVASALFYERGIRAAGVNLIAARAGVTKMTLYAHFGSKDGLVAAHLRARDQRWRDELQRRLAATSSPREQLLAIADAYRSWAETDAFRGCGFVNAAAELTDPDHPGRTVVAEHKRSVRDRLETIAQDAGCAEPADVAEEWFILLEGATITASIRGDAAPLHRARSMALRLLDPVEPPPRAR
jgi:AcrR family transcriptional regulator